jgi:excisionase family DNA binding protein
MITLTCKSFRVRHEAGSVILEIEAAEPANLIPQLLTKADVAKRLAISERKVETLAASGRLPVVRVDSCVRFREADVLRLLTENQEGTPRRIVSALPVKADTTG